MRKPLTDAPSDMEDHLKPMEKLQQIMEVLISASERIHEIESTGSFNAFKDVRAALMAVNTSHLPELIATLDVMFPERQLKTKRIEDASAAILNKYYKKLIKTQGKPRRKIILGGVLLESPKPKKIIPPSIDEAFNPHKQY